MDEDISQQLRDEALARLNQACLHAEYHGNVEKRAVYYECIGQYLQWFKTHNIPLYVQDNTYVFSPSPQTSIVSIKRCRVVVDGEVIYEGDDEHMALYILMRYGSDDRPRNVLSQMLRQEVPAGTDQEALTWRWSIHGAGRSLVESEAL